MKILKFANLLMLVFLSFSVSKVTAEALPKDCSAAKIPQQPVKGMIDQTVFIPAFVSFAEAVKMQLGDEKLQQYSLTFKSTDEFFAPQEVSINIVVPEGTDPGGKTFRSLPIKETMKQPSVIRGTPEIQMWSMENRKTGVSLSGVSFVESIKLKLSKRQGKKIKGSLYLCVPGGQVSQMNAQYKLEHDSYLVGEFTAIIKH